jgi:hypothetical protein
VTMFSPGTLTDCWRANSGGIRVWWLCSVLGASRTVEELIQVTMVSPGSLTECCRANSGDYGQSGSFADCWRANSRDYGQSGSLADCWRADSRDYGQSWEPRGLLKSWFTWLWSVLGASRTVEELIQEEFYVRWLGLVLGASWTVEELIEQEIMYVY